MEQNATNYKVYSISYEIHQGRVTVTTVASGVIDTRWEVLICTNLRGDIKNVVIWDSEKPVYNSCFNQTYPAE